MGAMRSSGRRREIEESLCFVGELLETCGRMETSTMGY